EKENVMNQFVKGQIDILVSTTVIEVGVDVPNASIMVVENSERFGLTQLHQLRGRIGRGKHDDVCILLTGFAKSEVADKRLSILEKTSSGFKVAEADLMLRGPGDFLGTSQSGIPQFYLANLIRDFELLKYARDDAFELTKSDPGLSSFPGLLKEVYNKWGEFLHLATIS
ncbi:MAG: helicase-related protein, partial [Calditrichia bacterium]